MFLRIVALGSLLLLSATRLQAQSAPAQKPYKKEIPAKLAAKAKVTETAAAATALAKVPGGTIQGVELENEKGKFIYSYDIKVAGKPGIEEVHVDAMTGTLIATEHENDPIKKPSKPLNKKP